MIEFLLLAFVLAFLAILVGFGVGIVASVNAFQRKSREDESKKDGVNRSYINRGAHNVKGDSNVSKRNGH